MKIHQTGTTTVEFAIIGALFFLILFAMVEFGRAFFVWNGLADVTRRAARIASVCPPNDADITRAAIYMDSETGGSRTISGLRPQDVIIRYLDNAMNDVVNPATTGFISVRYVQARIQGYTHQLMIPMFRLDLTPPDFASTVPAESLGRWKDADGNEYSDCYLPP